MLGAILLYVGIVLASNGLAGLCNVTDKSKIVINVFAGVMSFVLNMTMIVASICQEVAGNEVPAANYYSCATGLLFAFTYFYTAWNTACDFDGTLVGWFCIWVTITTIPVGIISCMDGQPVFGVIWWIWGALWLCTFLENNLKLNLGKFSAGFALFCGIFTGWIPGFLLLIEKWPSNW